MNEVIRQVSGHRAAALMYAHIEGGLVARIALVDPAYFASRPDRYPGQWICLRLVSGEDLPCAVGWTWSGSEFIPPPDPEDPAPSAPTEATP